MDVTVMITCGRMWFIIKKPLWVKKITIAKTIACPVRVYVYVVR